MQENIYRDNKTNTDNEKINTIIAIGFAGLIVLMGRNVLKHNTSYYIIEDKS